MLFHLTVPDAVDGVDEIRVLEWALEPPAAVDVGELIVELETHKAVVQVRAAQAGVLRAVYAEAGDWRAVGIPIALFSSAPDDDVSVAADGAAMLVEFDVT